MKSHLPVIIYWVFFVLGQFLYVLLKAWKVVQSPKNPVITTYGAYFRRFWIPLAARAFAGTCLFILAQAPSGFTASFAPDFFSNIKSFGLSGLCGLGTDGLLEKFVDKVPFLKGMLPQTDEVEPKADGKAAGQ